LERLIKKDKGLKNIMVFLNLGISKN